MWLFYSSSIFIGLPDIIGPWLQTEGTYRFTLVRPSIRHRLSWESLDEIFWNLVCRCLIVNENSPQSPIFDFGIFWQKKPVNIDKKWRKSPKSKPFDNIFWNLACRCFSTKENAAKKMIFRFQPFLAIFWEKNSQNWQKIKKIAKIQTVW